jgi:hypothetical protein
MQSAFPVQDASQNPYSHQGNIGQNHSSGTVTYFIFLFLYR